MRFFLLIVTLFFTVSTQADQLPSEFCKFGIEHNKSTSIVLGDSATGPYALATIKTLLSQDGYQFSENAAEARINLQLECAGKPLKSSKGKLIGARIVSSATLMDRVTGQNLSSFSSSNRIGLANNDVVQLNSEEDHLDRFKVSNDEAKLTCSSGWLEAIKNLKVCAALKH